MILVFSRAFGCGCFLYNENPAIVAGFYKGFADEQKTNKKSAENVLMSKAPLCKGSCRANARLRDCEMLRREQKEERKVSNNPSVIFLRKCHLPLHKGGLILVPLERVYVTSAWLAGQYTTHLCVATRIRAMPETEIPPVIRGNFYCCAQ